MTILKIKLTEVLDLALELTLFIFLTNMPIRNKQVEP